MADLAPVTRPNGKVYRPRKIVTWSWENEGYPDDECGAVVLGTHDAEKAKMLADHAVKRWFDDALIATKPEVAWFRLGYLSGVLTWLRDPVNGRAGVMFTADYPEADQ